MVRLSAAQLVARVRRHGGRAVWAVADQGGLPLFQLLLTPFLLAALGRAHFGLWMLAMTIVSMSPLTSFGAPLAATRHVAADLASGASSGATAAVRAALAVALLGGTATILALWLLARLIATALLPHMGSVVEVAPILAWCGPAVLAQEMDNVAACALRGAERYDLCARIEVVSRLAMAAAIALLAFRHATLAALLAALVAMTALKAGLKFWQLAVLLRDVRCCCPSVARGPLQRVLRFGGWQWLQSAGTTVFTAADQLLVGGLLGAALLARYSTCLQIAQYVHVLPSVMMQVIFPRLSALGAAISPRQGNEILHSATLLATGTALALAVPLAALARPILRTWIGADFAAENVPLLLILLGVHVALAFNIGAYYVLLGSDRTALSARIVLAAGAVQCALAVAAAPFGILAVACTRYSYALLTAFLYKAARYQAHES